MTLSGDVRRRYLHDACPDETFRAEVEALLAAHGRGLAVTAEIARGVSEWREADGASVSAQPDPVDGFRLIEKLGEGGMGEVWLAEQAEPVRRDVALKIVKRGMDSDAVLARFDAERQALALMNHPAVSRVYGAGVTQRGRPYFVMEAVRGDWITRHCDQAGLSLEQRLRLFCEVCDGVQHAHRRGIIHRDLKPANILVAVEDGMATPKIIDFGIAKATEQPLASDSPRTELGVAVGTPIYMSPEQSDRSRQDIDTRTDVYSLGVVLYELLTGDTPIPRAEWSELGPLEIHRRLSERPPDRPSSRVSRLAPDATEVAARRGLSLPQLHRRLRGDLDWIAMRALERDREHRYAGVEVLADDIRRFLTKQPVEARPPALTYRLALAMRRHRLAFGAVAILTFGLIVGAVGLVGGLVQARRAEREARLEAAKANAIGRFLLTDVLRSASPWRLGRSVRVVDVLDDAVRGMERLSEEQPEVALAVLHTAGDAFSSLGLYDRAIELLDRAAKEREALLGANDPETAASQLALGRAYVRANRHSEGLPLIERAAATLSATLGQEAPLTIEAETALISASYRLESADQSVVAIDTLARRAEEQFGLQDERTLEALSLLSTFLIRSNRLEEAETQAIRIADHYESIGNTGHPHYLLAQESRGQVAGIRGQFDEAERLIRESIAQADQSVGNDHPVVLHQRVALAELLSNYGRFEAAESEFLRVIQGYDALGGRESRLALLAREDLAINYRKMGRLDEAEFLAREVLEVRQRRLATDDSRTARSLDVLGMVYVDAGRHEEAYDVLRQSVAIYERSLGANHFETVGARFNMATLLETMGRLDQALAQYEALIPSTLEAYGPSHVYTGDAYFDVGRVRIESGDLVGAKAALEQAQAIYAETVATASPLHDEVTRLLESVSESPDPGEP